MKSGTVLLSFAAIATALSLLAVALSFATDHWKEFIVNRGVLKGKITPGSLLETDIKTNTIYFTSYRGLLRTCYPGNETSWLDAKPNKVDGSCLSEPGYELRRSPDTIGYGTAYEIRIHLLRAHFAFFCLALLFLLIGCILGAIGCWSLGSKVTRAAGLVVFFGAFFVASGMAVFHGYEYLEKNDIKESPFPAYWFPQERYKDLKMNSGFQYGYSYILGWVGMGVAAVGAILYLAAAWNITSGESDDRLSAPSEQKSRKPSHRNRAYDYMDKGSGEYPPTDMHSSSKGGYPPQPGPGYPDQFGDYNGYRY